MYRNLVTASLLVAMMLPHGFIFYLIWRKGSAKLIEPNKKILLVETILCGFILLYGIVEVTRIIWRLAKAVDEVTDCDHLNYSGLVNSSKEGE